MNLTIQENRVYPMQKDLSLQNLKIWKIRFFQRKDRIVALEYEIFTQVRQYIKGYVHEIQDVAKIVARIDVFSTFADVSSYNRYVRPTFNDDHIIQIEEGRHPVVEKVIPEESYVKNDISLGQDARIMSITGPNMGGKSTYMRQMALIMIMAQIGCFVPAKVQLFQSLMQSLLVLVRVMI